MTSSILTSSHNTRKRPPSLNTTQEQSPVKKRYKTFLPEKDKDIALFLPKNDIALLREYIKNTKKKIETIYEYYKTFLNENLYLTNVKKMGIEALLKLLPIKEIIALTQTATQNDNIQEVAQKINTINENLDYLFKKFAKDTQKPAEQDVKDLQENIQDLTVKILDINNFYKKLSDAHNRTIPTQQTKSIWDIKLNGLLELEAITSLNNLSINIDSYKKLKYVTQLMNKIKEKFEKISNTLKFEIDKNDEHQKRISLFNEADEAVRYLQDNTPTILDYLTKESTDNENTKALYTAQKIIQPKDLNSYEKEIQFFKDNDATSIEILSILKTIRSYTKTLKKISDTLSPKIIKYNHKQKVLSDFMYG